MCSKTPGRHSNKWRPGAFCLWRLVDLTSRPEDNPGAPGRVVHAVRVRGSFVPRPWGLVRGRLVVATRAAACRGDGCRSASATGARNPDTADRGGDANPLETESRWPAPVAAREQDVALTRPEEAG